MTNSLSIKGAALIRYFEGFKPRYYLDPVGVPTIGIGFTWASAGFRKWWSENRPGIKFGPGASMTREEAEAALVAVIAEEYGAAVNRFLSHRAVLQHVYDAASSMTFNCGPGALDWRWAEAMKAGKYDEAAALLKVTATTAKGRKLAGLVTRRKEEAELMQYGDYTFGAMTADAMADGMLVRGERGGDVGELQRNLAALGMYDGRVDEIFGYGTEAAVLEFQRSRGLGDDGFAGPKTLAAIKEALRPQPVAPAPAPAPSQPGGSVVTVPSVPVPTPRPSPADQVRKPLGGLKWGAIVGSLVTVLVGSDVLPPEFNTPEMVAALTAVAMAVANAVGTYRAEPNEP